MMDQLPRVSVVVPVLNGERWIGRCLDALQAQRYPAGLMEIIVADNGSTDGTMEAVRSRGVRLLSASAVRSPYAARNEAIAVADGEIIALTDADCVPIPEWLTRGVAPIVAGEADLVGGEVRFLLGGAPSMAELLDAAVNCEMRNSIQRRGVAKTANLLVHRRVFERIGAFRAEVRSGGDVAWTGQVTRAGFRLVYEPSAEVHKNPRRLRPLLRKQRRVGRGHVRLWREQGDGIGTIAGRSLASFLPRPPRKYAGLVRSRGLEDVPRSDVRLWFTGWLATVATGVGRVEELIGAGRDGT